MGVQKIERDGVIYLRNDADAPGYQHTLMPEVWAELEKQIKDGRLSPNEGDIASGVGFRQPDLIWYGDGEHDYISVTFETGTVVIRDGNDATGRAMQFGRREWDDFVADVSGTKNEDDRAERGSKKSPAEDGFTAGVDGDKTASEIAREKADVDDRETIDPKTTDQVNDSQPGSGGQSQQQESASDETASPERAKATKAARGSESSAAGTNQTGQERKKK